MTEEKQRRIDRTVKILEQLNEEKILAVEYAADTLLFQQRIERKESKVS